MHRANGYSIHSFLFSLFAIYFVLFGLCCMMCTGSHRGNKWLSIFSHLTIDQFTPRFESISEFEIFLVYFFYLLLLLLPHELPVTKRNKNKTFQHNCSETKWLLSCSVYFVHISSICTMSTWISICDMEWIILFCLQSPKCIIMVVHNVCLCDFLGTGNWHPD